MSVPVAALLRRVRTCLAEAGLDDPASDARFLIAGLLDLPHTVFLTDPDRAVTASDLRRVDDAVARRLAREPVFRILGQREFYGLPFALSKDTLEPRPDTEILVDRVLPYLRRIAALKGKAKIIDFGTGTGAIALALLANCPAADALGVDISGDALETAAANARSFGLSARFSTLQSDWAERVTGSFDIVVSNPPYIVRSVLSTVSPEVRLYDPAAALDGGEDGLDAYRALADAMPKCLAGDGLLGLEIGHDQMESVETIMARAGLRLIEAVKDYGGRDRVMLFSIEG